MAQRDDRYQHDEQHHQQMGQYADDARQYGGQRDGGRQRDTRGYDNRQGSDLSRNDPAQVSYGRASAPDVHGRPSGGYRRDHQADPGYNQPGYMQNQGGPYEREQDRRDSWRGHGGHDDQRQAYAAHRGDEGRDWDRRRAQGDERSEYGRYQGGAGGYRSNAGVYAGSQTYGGYGDQLGYGSYDDGRHQQQHHDPDYQQWRQQQMRSLDEDYQTWRGERYKKFSDEFDTWRQGRQAGSAAQKADADASGQNVKPGSGDGSRPGGAGSK